MNAFELLLQLGTVFLGAFLAFWLENLRERQQLRGWANDYLRRIREDLSDERDTKSTESLEATIADYATFITFETGYVPDENEWNLLMNLSLSVHKDYRALLESTAVRVLPAELIKALGELDGYKRADETIMSLCQAAWEQYAVPLALKQSPIEDAERRGIEYVRGLLEIRVEHTEERYRLEQQVLGLLNEYNLGR